MNLDNLPFVSIIIPTYHDWNRLFLCMEALERQTYPKRFFEIIVINNDPTDKQPENSDHILTENHKIIVESRPGSYAARNAGLKIAKGEIIGFTDSDCIPDKFWIENAVKMFLEEDISRIGGKIEIFYSIPKHPKNSELYEKIFAFKQEEVVLTMGSSVTGNMFTKRNVFDVVGYFNDSLLSGGDHEWSKRAKNLGYNISYGYNVTIYHPARKNLKDILKKARRIGGGSANLNNMRKDRAIISFLRSFKPSAYSLYMIRKYGNELSWLQKIKVYFIRIFIVYITNWEKLQVSFGKQPNRE